MYVLTGNEEHFEIDILCFSVRSVSVLRLARYLRVGRPLKLAVWTPLRCTHLAELLLSSRTTVSRMTIFSTLDTLNTAESVNIQESAMCPSVRVWDFYENPSTRHASE